MNQPPRRRPSRSPQSPASATRFSHRKPTRRRYGEAAPPSLILPIVTDGALGIILFGYGLSGIFHADPVLIVITVFGFVLGLAAFALYTETFVAMVIALVINSILTCILLLNVLFFFWTLNIPIGMELLVFVLIVFAVPLTGFAGSAVQIIRRIGHDRRKAALLRFQDVQAPEEDLGTEDGDWDEAAKL